MKRALQKQGHTHCMGYPDAEQECRDLCYMVITI